MQSKACCGRGNKEFFAGTLLTCKIPCANSFPSIQSTFPVERATSKRLVHLLFTGVRYSGGQRNADTNTKQGEEFLNSRKLKRNHVYVVILAAIPCWQLIYNLKCTNPQYYYNHLYNVLTWKRLSRGMQQGKNSGKPTKF